MMVFYLSPSTWRPEADIARGPGGRSPPGLAITQTGIGPAHQTGIGPAAEGRLTGAG